MQLSLIERLLSSFLLQKDEWQSRPTSASRILNIIWLIEFVLVSMCSNDNKLNCKFAIISILWFTCIHTGIYIYDLMMSFSKRYISGKTNWLCYKENQADEPEDEFEIGGKNAKWHPRVVLRGKKIRWNKTLESNILKLN